MSDIIRKVGQRGVRVHSGLWAERVRLARDLLGRSTDEADQERLRQLAVYAPQIQRLAVAGRVRPRYVRQGPGRWGATEPLIQQVTRSHGLRDAVVPEDGNVLLVGDWRSCHLWIAAALSGCSALLADLREGDPYSGWPGDDRATGKIAALSTINGAQPRTLAAQLGVERALAKDAREAWLARYPELAAFLRAHRGLREWSTPSGRTVVVPSSVPDYACPAWRWQSVEADVLLSAVESAEAGGLECVLLVHDELVVEARAPGEDAADLLESVMRSALARTLGLTDAEVPGCVRVDVRPSWGGGVPEVWPGLESPSTQPPAPEVPIVVVHGPSWWVLEGQRYLAVQPALVRAELMRLHPHVDVDVLNAEGEARPAPPAELYARHGVTARRLRWSYNGGLDWDPVTRTLDVPSACVAEGAAERHPEVEEWLDCLTTRPDTLLDWLATCHLLQRPTAALQLRGPPGVGKAMLAEALAAYLGGGSTYDQAVGEMTSAVLVWGPLVLLDEGALESRPDHLRRLVGGTEHAVKEVYRAPEVLRGCPRLLITANGHDPLLLARGDLDPESEAALGERIIALDATTAARDYLRRLGGRDHTDGWTEPDGPICRHLRWLREARIVERGSRWLVQGDGATWRRDLMRRSDLAETLRDHYAAYVDADPQARRQLGREPYHFDGDDLVYVSCGSVLATWTPLLGDPRPPSSKAVAAVLAQMAGGPPVRSNRGPRAYRVPTTELRRDT